MSEDILISYFPTISDLPGNTTKAKNLDEYILKVTNNQDVVKIGETKINDIKAIEITPTGEGSAYWLYLEKDNHIYLIAFNNVPIKKLLTNAENQILSTFKFISTSTPITIDTSDWKIYTNKVGYEIKYPANWVYTDCFDGTQLMFYSNPNMKEGCDEPHGNTSDLSITGPVKNMYGSDDKKEEITVNGAQAFKYTIKVGQDDPLQTINYIGISTGSKIFGIDFKNDSTLIEKIIYTFKFTK
jgi:hypothetical protein